MKKKKERQLLLVDISFTLQLFLHILRSQAPNYKTYLCLNLRVAADEALGEKVQWS